MLLPEGIDPAEPRKPGEVGIVRVQFSLVLDGQRRELSVGREIPGGAERPQQRERDFEMMRTRHSKPHVRSGQPLLDVLERIADAQRRVEHLRAGGQADEAEECRGAEAYLSVAVHQGFPPSARFRVLGEARHVGVQE